MIQLISDFLKLLILYFWKLNEIFFFFNWWQKWVNRNRITITDFMNYLNKLPRATPEPPTQEMMVRPLPGATPWVGVFFKAPWLGQISPFRTNDVPPWRSRKGTCLKDHESMTDWAEREEKGATDSVSEEAASWPSNDSGEASTPSIVGPRWKENRRTESWVDFWPVP